MSAISKEGYEQMKVIKNALDSMYGKLNEKVYIKSGRGYRETNVFESVQSEFEAIAGIVEQSSTWTEV